jgi:hypothetical protein
MAAINDDLRSVLVVLRSETDARKRDACLAAVIDKLVKNYLRRHNNSDEREDELDRVLMIVGQMATKQKGAFGWGDPRAVGPTILGLIECLPHPSEERQRKVLGTLGDILDLLRVGSARAVETLGREAVGLLGTLGSTPPTIPSAGLALPAFDGFAGQC